MKINKLTFQKLKNNLHKYSKQKQQFTVMIDFEGNTYKDIDEFIDNNIERIVYEYIEKTKNKFT